MSPVTSTSGTTETAHDAAHDDLSQDSLEEPPSSGKPMRADARRNYDKLVTAAREAFRTKGKEATLDDIAKAAGVGAGTLYRHFPTRDDLMDAVMRDWVEAIQSDSTAVAAMDGTPRELLDAWFTRFLTHVALYQGMAAKLVASMDDDTSPIYRKCQVLGVANREVLTPLIESGALREGVEPREVMRMVTGVAAVADQAQLSPEQTRPMLEIIIDGVLRP